MTLAAPLRRHRTHTSTQRSPTTWDHQVEHRLAFEAAQQGLRLTRTCVSVSAPYYLYNVRTNRLLTVAEGGMTLDQVARYLFR